MKSNAIKNILKDVLKRKKIASNEIAGIIGVATDEYNDYVNNGGPVPYEIIRDSALAIGINAIDLLEPSLLLDEIVSYNYPVAITPKEALSGSCLIQAKGIDEELVYPISKGSLDNLQHDFLCDRLLLSQQDMLCIETMNNKLVMINKNHLQHYAFIDDDVAESGETILPPDVYAFFTHAGLQIGADGRNYFAKYLQHLLNDIDDEFIDKAKIFFNDGHTADVEIFYDSLSSVVDYIYQGKISEPADFLKIIDNNSQTHYFKLSEIALIEFPREMLNVALHCKPDKKKSF